MTQTELQYKDLKGYCNGNLSDNYFGTFKHIFKQAKALNCRYFLVFDGYQKYIAILHECNVLNVVNKTHYPVLGYWVKLLNRYNIEISIVVNMNNQIYSVYLLGICTSTITLERLIEIAKEEPIYCLQCNKRQNWIFLYDEIDNDRTEFTTCCKACEKQLLAKEIINNFSVKIKDII